MMTGKTVPGHGVYRLYDNLPDEEVLFTKHLQQAGYKTALFGKLHVTGRLEEASRRHPNDGFDIYEWCMEPSLHIDSPFNGYTRWLKQKSPAFYQRLKREGRDLQRIPRELHMNYWAAENTIDLIDQSSPDKPFFGLMSVFDPHNPYTGYPPEMADLIDEEQIEDPLWETGQEPEPVRRERAKSHLGKIEKFTKQELRRMRRDYHATIAFFDEQVGRVLRALDDKGISDNTLVIVTSDGGDMLGDHRLLAKGAFLYDSSIRVPLLMRWPNRIPAGRRVNELTQLQDLAATILSAAGQLTSSLQSAMPESHDLVPLAQGKVERVRDFAVCTWRNTGITVEGQYSDPPIHATMIRTRRYKLVAYLNPPGHREVFEGQLFDMQQDPQELNNLWNRPDHREIQYDLMTRLAAWETRQELLGGSRGGGQVPGLEQRLDNRLKR
jgi:arylsulfatase A-like enzyme